MYSYWSVINLWTLLWPKWTSKQCWKPVLRLSCPVWSMGEQMLTLLLTWPHSLLNAKVLFQVRESSKKYSCVPLSGGMWVASPWLLRKQSRKQATFGNKSRPRKRQTSPTLSATFPSFPATMPSADCADHLISVLNSRLCYNTSSALSCF